MYYWGNSMYNSYYIVMIAAFVITLIAQIRVKTTFNKYSTVFSSTGMTGAMTAANLLASQGIGNVAIGRVQGSLTDHYNPSNKTLGLSEPVYDKTSLSAIAVAAHECGHAMQHAFGYGPLALRTAIVPIASFSSRFSWIFLIIGLFYYSTVGSIFLRIGIIMFSAAVLFQLITLPVEINASRRALVLLEQNGILTPQENKGAKAVLRAASMTYVAAASASILQLLRLIAIARSRR